MDGRPRILVVDDEAHVRAFFRLAFKNRTGIHIIEAANGESALAAAAEFRPSLVLLDINLPRMTGLEALPEMRRMLPNAQIVMVTGLATRQAVKEAFAAGASGYLRKDTPIDQLFEAIDRAATAAGISPGKAVA